MTRSRISLVVSFAILIFSQGCRDSGDSPVNSLLPGPTPSTYDYRAYTSGGTLAVVGTITLQIRDSLSLTGTWANEGVSDLNKIGPQVGAGTLVGKLDGLSISVNLNPGWADNNVILAGSVEADKISGTWTWVSFIGPTSSGKFEATLPR
jgi:hypothetical protein